MTAVTDSLQTALLIAKDRKMAIPRCKRWGLLNPENDMVQIKACYWRNRNKIVANNRIRYQKEKGANAGDLNEHGQIKSVGAGQYYPL
jgi:hypothetical protein